MNDNVDEKSLSGVWLCAKCDNYTSQNAFLLMMMMIQFKVDIKIKNDQMQYQGLNYYQHMFAFVRLLFE